MGCDSQPEWSGGEGDRKNPKEKRISRHSLMTKKQTPDEQDRHRKHKLKLFSITAVIKDETILLGTLAKTVKVESVSLKVSEITGS